MPEDPTMAEPGGPPTGPPAGADPSGGVAPPGGGPILAALSKARGQPEVSAPGMGDQAKSMMAVKSAVDLITGALPGLQGTPLYDAALNFLRRAGKNLAQGQPTAGVQQTQLQDMLRKTAQAAIFQKILGQRQAQGQEDNPNMPAGASPNLGAAPMPSTPLPGA